MNPPDVSTDDEDSNVSENVSISASSDEDYIPAFRAHSLQTLLPELQSYLYEYFRIPLSATNEFTLHQYQRDERPPSFRFVHVKIRFIAEDQVFIRIRIWDPENPFGDSCYHATCPQAPFLFDNLITLLNHIFWNNPENNIRSRPGVVTEY